MYNRHLDLFLLTADCGSFSKAAEKAFISPNAVIKQMNLLETELGVTLFTRTNQGVSLTKAGESIYRDAKKIIRLSGQAKERAREAARKEALTVRIGTSLLRPCKTIIDLWNRVDQDAGITLEVVPFDDTVDNYRKLLENLGQDIDIVAGIYSRNLCGRRCLTMEIERQPLCCAVSRKHRLAGKQRLQMEDLYGENLLMVQRGDTEYIDLLRDEIERHHPQIHIQDVPPYDTKVFNQCEMTGSVMVTIANWSELHPSLVTLPCDWEYTVPYGILYARHPSKAVLQFLDAMKTMKE